MQLALGGAGLSASVGVGLGGALMNMGGPSGRPGGTSGGLGQLGIAGGSNGLGVGGFRNGGGLSLFGMPVTSAGFGGWAPGRAWTVAGRRALVARCTEYEAAQSQL